MTPKQELQNLCDEHGKEKVIKAVKDIINEGLFTIMHNYDLDSKYQGLVSKVGKSMMRAVEEDATNDA